MGYFIGILRKTKLKNFITFTAFNLILLPGIALAQLDGYLSLTDLINETIANNPGIHEARNLWEAAEHKAKRIKGLDDPIASYGYFGEEVQTRTGPQEQKIGVSQKIPFPGKLNLKGKAQSKEALVYKEKFKATKNEVIKEVKFVYYDLFWADRAIQINEEEKELLEKLENVAQRKYESNLVPQHAVIKVQVELSKIIKKLFLLRQNRQSLAVKLNSLLNRPHTQDVQQTSKIDEYSFSYELDDIVTKVNKYRQELVAANLSVEKAEHEKSLAKMAYLPDFTVGGEFIDIGGGTTSLLDDGQDAWMAKVSVNVPIWFGKLKAQVKEKEAELEAAKQKKSDVKNRVVYEAQDIYFKINAYQDIVLLYETALLPQAEQAYDASQVGFETGSVSFIDWLDTERTYLQTRLAYYKAITDYHKSIATLERIAGGQL